MLRNAVLRAARGLEIVASAAMLGILLVICSSVLSRALINKPIAGALEASMLLMPVVVFGGMAWVFARVGHFAMTSLIDARRGRLRPIGLVLQVCIGTVIFAMLSVESVELAYKSFLRGEYFAGPVNIPVYYSRFMIAIGSVITTLALIFVFLPENLGKFRRKNLEKQVHE